MSAAVLFLFPLDFRGVAKWLRHGTFDPVFAGSNPVVSTMQTKIIEASTGINWGRFLLQRFEASERAHRSHFEPISIWKDSPPPQTALWVLDLITGEGALFDLAKPLEEQLAQHQVWVCVLFEPFLAWLEARFRQASSLDAFWDALPAGVQVSAAPEVIGYRHGAWIAQLPQEALHFLAHPLVGGQLPRSLKALLKKLLPSTRTR